MTEVLDRFWTGQEWLFEHLLQPLLLLLGMDNLLAEGYVAAGWLLVGLVQLGLMVTLMGALERWRPAQAITDPAAVRTDIVYTLIHRLGLFRVLMFLSIDPLWDAAIGQLRLAGYVTPELDRWLPGVTDLAWVSFLMYLVLFDFVDYWYHRASHRFNWWWALHALHHSQQQLTYWTDNRNHLLDDLMRDSVFVLLALLIGVPPAQFIGLVALTQLVESLSHANVRLDFGPLRYLLVGPAFHRWHHDIGPDEAAGRPEREWGGNYAVLFPVWDVLFGTAHFNAPSPRPGIRDQLRGRDYGRGFWAQQWLGLMRLAGRA